MHGVSRRARPLVLSTVLGALMLAFLLAGAQTATANDFGHDWSWGGFDWIDYGDKVVVHDYNPNGRSTMAEVRYVKSGSLICECYNEAGAAAAAVTWNVSAFDNWQIKIRMYEYNKRYGYTYNYTSWYTGNA